MRGTWKEGSLNARSTLATQRTTTARAHASQSNLRFPHSQSIFHDTIVVHVFVHFTDAFSFFFFFVLSFFFLLSSFFLLCLVCLLVWFERGDHVLARQGRALLKILGEQPIDAEVHAWETATDVLNIFQSFWTSTHL